MASFPKKPTSQFKAGVSKLQALEGGPTSEVLSILRFFWGRFSIQTLRGGNIDKKYIAPQIFEVEKRPK